MAGSLYIWMVGAVFLGCVGVILLFTILLYAGHWMDKKRTGAKHGFLELPPELQSRPAPPSSSFPPDAKEPPPSGPAAPPSVP